ncbi:DUF6095 family protein [Flavobacterium chungnamense]|uniref:DUF6095 family protein n=1 Tax=Flavobacterium chungnamense TaxID=706182 RepID=A0ABP7UEK2_9FLAO
MATNKELLAKGVKYLFGALPLMFVGPIILNSSFKNKDNPYYYLVLSIGIVVCLSAMFLAFKGIKTMTDALFNDKQ